MNYQSEHRTRRRVSFQGESTCSFPYT